VQHLWSRYDVSAEPSIPEGFRWRCLRKVAGVKCSASRSIRTGSWLQQSTLTFREVLLVTYGIVCREPAHRIMEEYCLSLSTVADWGMFCRETMLVFMADCSEELGGPNKIVEVDESKFRRRKYDRGHPLKGQWVFGDVERESGITCAPCQLLLPATRDHTNWNLLQVSLLLQYVTPTTSLTPPHCVKDIMRAPLSIISVTTAILGPGI